MGKFRSLITKARQAVRNHGQRRVTWISKSMFGRISHFGFSFFGVLVVVGLILSVLKRLDLGDRQVGDLLILESLVLFVIVRWGWFVGKFAVYSLAAYVLSFTWAVRLCVRLWIWTNWDLGESVLTWFRNPWDYSVEKASSDADGGELSTTVRLKHEETEYSWRRQIMFQRKHGHDEEAVAWVKDNLDEVDKLAHYRRRFGREADRMIPRRIMY